MALSYNSFSQLLLPAASSIREGSKSKILNLLWLLICHYQITDTGRGPKSTLLDVIQACLPEKPIFSNLALFTSDWNDGILLSTLINFCDSSLVIDYKWLEADEAPDNVEKAFQTAEESLAVPQIMAKEDLLAEHPDERSFMTYLSYFCVGLQSPVQKKLLEWIQEQTEDESIVDFSGCWVDGKKLGVLVQAVSPEGFSDLKSVEEEAGSDSQAYCQHIMENAQQLLNIDMTITAAQFVSPNLNPLLRVTYLIQFYFSSKEVKVREIHVPKEAGAGALVWLDLVVPVDLVGHIQASASGNTVGDVPTEIEDNDDFHRIQFETEIQDLYSLSVSVGKIRVNGSPFKIDLSPPDPSLVVVTSTSAIPKKVGIPIILVLDTKDAGYGEIVADATGDESGEAPSSVDKMGSSTYQVSFIPMQAEKYSLEVRMNGQHIKGSPFSFDLTALIEPEAVEIGRPVKGGIGELVRIPINISAAGNAKLEVQCTGKEVGPVEVSYNPPEKPTEISFIPTSEDVYTVSVFFDGSEVIDSPFEVNLIPIPPDASNVHLVRPPSNSVKGKDQIRIGFNAAEAGDGVLTVTCSGFKVGDMEVSIEETPPDEYDVLFTPTDSDDYTVTVQWSGQNVPGSPFHMKLKPKDYPEPSKCQIMEFPSSSQLLLVGEPIRFRVDTWHAGKGVLDAMVEVSRENSTKEEDQVSVVSTMTRDSDTYSRITAMEEEDRELEPIMEDREVTIGQEKVMRIRAKKARMRLDSIEDRPLKRSASELEWAKDMEVDNMLEFEDDENAKLTIDQSEEEPGLYHVTYLPVIDGTHTMNIYWSDMPLPSSPISVRVTKAQIGLYKEPVSVEVRTVFMRKQLKTRIEHRDGKVLKDIKVRMDKVKTGHYFLVFTPPQPGVYLLHVSAKKKYLPQSPYVISYIKPSMPLRQRVKLSSFSNNAFVGQPFTFLIKAEDTDSLLSHITVTRRKPSGDESEEEEELDPVQLEATQDGSVRVIFTPTAAGEEKVEVKVDGSLVPGCPVSVNVSEEDGEEAVAPSLSLSPVQEEKKDKSKKKKKDGFFNINLNDQKFTVGTPCKFKVDCRELGSGDLLVTTKPSAAAEITVKDASESNVHSVEITPKKSGKCELIIKHGSSDAHVPGSPFALHVLARGSAEKCVLLENSDCAQGENNEKLLCVSTKGAGKGKLTASMKTLSSDKEVAVSVEQDSKHHHHLKFTPSHGLNYLLTVKFDEIDIAGSPFKILLGNPSLTTVEGGSLTKPWSGRDNTFYVFSENSGPGELTVYIESDEDDMFNSKSAKVSVEVTQLEEFKYQVSYQPKNPGIYWVSIKWKDVHIPDSPFKAFCLKPLSPNQFSIADPAPFTHNGKPAKFLVVVDKTIHEDDKLTATMYDTADREATGEVTRRNDTSYSVTLNPPRLDNYSVFILWDKQHITGSPFKVENVEPPKSTELSITDVREEGGDVCMQVSGPMLSFRYGNLRSYLTLCTSKEEDSYLASSDIQTKISSISHSESLVRFKPMAKQKYHLNVWYDSEHIKGSPFQLAPTGALQCCSAGLGLRQAQTHRPNKFIVFTENSGHGQLNVEILGTPDDEEEEASITPEVIASVDGTRQDVSYVVSKSGRYTMSVKWEDDHIPNSPFELLCCNPARYSVLSPPPQEAVLTRPLKFGLHQASPPPGHEQLTVFTRDRDGVHHQGSITRGSDDSFLCSVCPPELGKYLVHIQCNGFEVTNSPFRIQCLPTPVPGNVVASGPGLSDGCAGQKGSFEIDVSTAGHSQVALKVQGPKNGFRVDLNQDPARKRVILADYNPTYPGRYSLGILWDGVHVPNSPFTVNIEESIQSPARGSAAGVTMDSVR